MLFVWVPLGISVYGHFFPLWAQEGHLSRESLQTHSADFIATFRHEIVRGTLLWAGWESGRESHPPASSVSLASFTLEHSGSQSSFLIHFILNLSVHIELIVL